MQISATQISDFAIILYLIVYVYTCKKKLNSLHIESEYRSGFLVCVASKG